STDLRLGTDLNRQFHMAICRAAARPQLLDIIERLRRSADAYVQLLVTKAPPEYIDDVVQEHRDIVAALKGRAPGKAHKAMTKHLRRSLAQISDVI
ncbi:MAG: GntR family transcriptional regulator, partial [Solirubrobacterales bacterium]|nr:GntR family transcriptional regulator [Solirubrobacterales bacterium]